MMNHKLLLLALLPLAVAPAATLRAQSPSPAATVAAPGYVAAFRPGADAPLAERQARTANRLSQRMVGGEAQLLTNFRALYNDVWRNADGLTPQQVCDALGTRAGSLFVIAGTMANALYQIDPAGLGAMVNVPAGYAATIQADGTVTLTFTPPPTPAP